MKKLILVLVIIVWWILYSGRIIKSTNLLETQTIVPTLIQENNQCIPSFGKPEKKVFWLSDPSFLDDKVRNFAIDLGTKWIRTDFNWNKIETSNGTYDFSQYDTIVETMKHSNIQILGIINHIPEKYDNWNDINQQYEKFLTALFTRYKDTIQYWEVFNEPNLPWFWWLSSGLDSKEYINAYSHILYLTNKNFRKINPNGFLILWWLSPSGQDPFEFLTKLYDLNSQKCFDIIGIHPYGFENKITILNKKIKEFLILKNDWNKPVWFTEFGSDDESSKQQTLINILKEIDNTDGFFWFSIKDFNPITNLYGLVDFYNKKREIYYYMQKNIFRKITY
jgi:hypothetical protein